MKICYFLIANKNVDNWYSPMATRYHPWQLITTFVEGLWFINCFITRQQTFLNLKNCINVMPIVTCLDLHVRISFEQKDERCVHVLCVVILAMNILPSLKGFIITYWYVDSKYTVFPCYIYSNQKVNVVVV